jgi:hypothetical protein
MRLMRLLRHMSAMGAMPLGRDAARRDMMNPATSDRNRIARRLTTPVRRDHFPAA